MFDFVRSHRSWMMLFILVLILPSFVFFGIQGYNNYVDQDGALATVDGAPITFWISLCLTGRLPTRRRRRMSLSP